MLAAVAPVLYALWCVPVLPTHDGPKNLYAAHVFAHANEPAFRGDFERQLAVTGFGFAWLYAPLERVLGWRVAYQASITLLVLGVAAGHFALARALSPRRALLGLVALGAAMQWALYMGFVNYLGSLGLGLAALGVGLARERWSVRREVAIAALLWAACAFHPSGAQLAGAGLGLFRARTSPRGRRLREIGLLFLVGVPPMAASLVANDALATALARGVSSGVRVDLPLRELVENFRLCFLFGPAWRAYPPIALALGGIALALVRFARRETSKGEQIVLLLAVGMGALAFLTPWHGAGWQYFSPRFIPLAILLGSTLVPAESLGDRARAAMVSALLVFGAASNAWAAAQNRAFAARHADALAGFGLAAPKGRTLLPLVALPETVKDEERDRRLTIPYAVPMLNWGALYAVDRDAPSPYAFSFLPFVHVIRGKPRPGVHLPKRDYGYFFRPETPPADRRGELARIASFGTDYDDVVFVGEPEDAARFERFGYRTELLHGGLFLGHFVGCRARFETDGPLAGEADVSMGWDPTYRVAWRTTAPAGAAVAIDLPRVSCDGFWVRLGSETATCKGADAEGRVHATVDRDGLTTLRCELAPLPAK